MIAANTSRNLAAPARAGCFPVVFLVAGWLALVMPLRADNPPTYLFEIDSSAVPGGFSPESVTLDNSNNVYVTEFSAHRVVKLAGSGSYLTQWGTYGTTNGQFNLATGIALDSSNNVFVVDYGNNRVEKFDSSGNYLTQWRYGSGYDQNIGHNGIAVDRSNNVYVINLSNCRVEKFTGSGRYLTQWGSYGSGNGQFVFPGGIVVDSSNNVYVADSGNNHNRVQKFTSNGNYLKQWDVNSYADYLPAGGIAVDCSDNVCVTAYDTPRVEKFDSSGSYLTQWGSYGSGNGQFISPGGIAVGSSGNFIYVADDKSARIQVFVYNTNIIPPIITNQPAGQTVPAGSNVTLIVSVVGTAPFAYQWSSNSVAVPGATNASFTLTNVSLSDSATYAVLVTNSFGSAWSRNTVLAVLPALVTTLPASGLSVTGAVLNGSVTVGPAETVVWFDWGTDTNYGNIAGATIVPGNNGSNSISAALSGLPGSFYHYRLDAANDFGIVYGDDQSFTVGFAPTATTLSPINNTNGSTLNAKVNPEGWDTTIYFQWGTPTLTNSTPGMDIGAGVTSLDVSNFVLGLAPFTPYRYQVVASNALGTVLGEVVSWTPPFVSVSGEAGVVFTGFHSFSGDDGASPNGLVQASDGSFYGTTWGGGTTGGGTVFKISDNGVLTSLHSFNSLTDGSSPNAGLVQGSDGYLYGTTYSGGFGSGLGGAGTVFRISTNAALGIFAFNIGPYSDCDGFSPIAGLVQGSDGNLYGTTAFGGNINLGWEFRLGDGNVFKLSTNGVGTNLFSFSGSGGYSVYPSGLVQGSDGYLYGTTFYGGTNGAGNVFQISTNGAYVSLHSFTGTNDGNSPEAALVQGSDGFLYGTTAYGGTNGAGTVFQISTNGAFASLYSFTGTNDGAYPDTALVQGRDGTLYGTTFGGGNSGNPNTFPGNGTVFAIRTNGTGFTILYRFSASSTNASGVYTNSDGANPYGGLILVGNTLYGTTSAGGSLGDGTVFSLTLPGPQLTITPSGANVILRWPTNATGFTLEFATNLVSPVIWYTNWTPPVVISGQNVVTNPITGSQQFFRLSQ